MLISSACARDSSVFGPTMKASGRSLPRVISPMVTWRGAALNSIIANPSNQARLIERSAHEGGKQRMRLEGFGFELGVKLHADEPGVIGNFDDFRQHAVRRYARKAQPGRF